MKPTTKSKGLLRSLLLTGGLALSLLPGNIQAQSKEQNWCKSTLTPQQQQHMIDTREARQNFDASMHRGTIKWVPVTWHLFRNSAGTAGATLANVNTVMTRLNKEFAGANIQFYLCGAPKFINDDNYYIFLSHAEAADYGLANDVPNTMNVYVPYELEGVRFGGYAYFPGGPERVAVALQSMGSGILIHEVGHFFALYHTHGDDKIFEGFSNVDELVDGTNCAYAGDDVCDTPADPDLTGRTSSCVYTGTVLDGNGQPYNPMVNNFMSYAPTGCVTAFTPGQYNHMAYAAIYERANLGCNSNPAPCISPVTSYPYKQSFEGGTLNDWLQGTGDDFNWTLSNAATPTANTGPDAAQHGSWYAFIENTGNTGFKTSELFSGCFDLTYTTSPELTFYYHMFGTNTGSLTVQTSTDAGATWTNQFYKTGTQGNAWNLATINLKQFVDQTFLRVRIIAATQGSGDLGDIGIDNIDVHSTTCAGTTASISHTDIACQHTNSGTATLSVTGASSPWTYLWSNGATTSSLSSLSSGAYKVTVTDNLGCQTTLGTFVNETIFRIDAGGNTPNTDYTLTNPDGTLTVLITGGVSPYTLTWTKLVAGNPSGTITGITGSSYTITGLTHSMYRIEVWDATGCKQGITNLRVSGSGCHSPGSITSLPYSEGFESGTGLWTPYCATGSTQYFPFVHHTGATPQANTGPDAAAEGSYYCYSDASANTGTQSALLLGPRFNVNTRATLRFKYHQYGANCTSINFQATNLTSGNQPAPVILWTGPTGDQGNTWIQAAADLNPLKLTPDLTMFFRALTPGGTLGEIGVDDIQIIDCSGTTVTPVTTDISCLGSDGKASITLSGAGAPYTYLWSNGATTNQITGLATGTYTVTASASNGCVFTETYNVEQTLMVASTQVTHQAIIGSNDGAINLTVTNGQPAYTYLWSNGATTQDLSNLAPGTYTVTVTDSRGCTTTESATVFAGVCVDYVNSYPYSESFEGTTLGIWSNVTGDNFDWTGPFTGSTPTTGSGPDVAADGTKYLYTEANPSNYPNKTAWLVSQCFDLTGASAATFTFKYHLYTTKASNMGSLSLQASTDGGSTWSSNLFNTSGNLGNSWFTGSVNLNSYVGKYVKLRFTGTTGNGDKADRGLDQFSLTITPLKTVDFAPGIAAGSDLLGNVNLFPNPNQGDFSVTFECKAAETVTLRLLDVQGKVINSQTVNAIEGMNNVQLNAATRVAGMYFVEITAADSKVVKRMVITE